LKRAIVRVLALIVYQIKQLKRTIPIFHKPECACKERRIVMGWPIAAIFAVNEQNRGWAAIRIRWHGVDFLRLKTEYSIKRPTACQLEYYEDKERFEEKRGKTRRQSRYSSARRPLFIVGLARLGLIGCLALVACAPANWVKPGATQADHDRDVNECQRVAQQGALFGLGKGWAIQNSFKHCMTLRGYVTSR
jgi:hypothetical protein